VVVRPGGEATDDSGGHGRWSWAVDCSDGDTFEITPHMTKQIEAGQVENIKFTGSMIGKDAAEFKVVARSTHSPIDEDVLLVRPLFVSLNERFLPYLGKSNDGCGSDAMITPQKSQTI
jgi:hypothetical protein